ncbi:hypothetical protein MKZ38_005947 [Zalerion maritima]|uniref:Protein prenyltransferase alpha subunit n=1 Tax=Zalerion maritima TaxID=339359 RepID=A0AAD5S3Q4_9PEZI|nr:hypothetical protein MKZ38_005947 [Zalerion maritima]
MSRVLDKSVIESLNKSDPTPVYSDISRLLDDSLDEGLLEIELLGSAHPLEPNIHFLRDGNAVAIPKLRLVQAFFVARKILMSEGSKPLDSFADDAAAAAALRRATGVVLLMDPEHLTAANRRKLLIQHRAISALNEGKTGPGNPIALVIQREKLFLDSLLTSHLHRHTKSPTLWSHRRWLLETSRICGLVTDIVADMKQVVTVSANRHPRNYYAWSHARWMVDSVIVPQRRLEAYEEVVKLVKDWCFRNHSDTSGWSFLYSMLKMLQPQGRGMVRPIFQETLQLSSSFRWTNESVWVFLRTVAASGMVGDTECLEFNDRIKELMPLADEKTGTRLLDNALRWYRYYKIPASSHDDDIS